MSQAPNISDDPTTMIPGIPLCFPAEQPMHINVKPEPCVFHQHHPPSFVIFSQGRTADGKPLPIPDDAWLENGGLVHCCNWREYRGNDDRFSIQDEADVNMILRARDSAAAKEVIYLVFATDCFASYTSWPEILDSEMRRLGKSGDRQPPVKIWRIVGENASYDADEPGQNSDYTNEEVVDGTFLLEEIEWWMEREGKQRMSEEDKIALGWVHPRSRLNQEGEDRWQRNQMSDR